MTNKELNWFSLSLAQLVYRWEHMIQFCGFSSIFSIIYVCTIQKLNETSVEYTYNLRSNNYLFFWNFFCSILIFQFCIFLSVFITNSRLSFTIFFFAFYIILHLETLLFRDSNCVNFLWCYYMLWRVLGDISHFHSVWIIRESFFHSTFICLC